jgi:hypothetical protein
LEDVSKEVVRLAYWDVLVGLVKVTAIVKEVCVPHHYPMVIVLQNVINIIPVPQEAYAYSFLKNWRLVWGVVRAITNVVPNIFVQL